MYNYAMNSVESQKNTCWWLLQTAWRMKPFLIQIADFHKLTLAQLHLLLMIEPGQALPMNIISKFLGCDASNVTGLVDRLSARSLISRREHPTDRRVKAIELTKEGKMLRENLLRRLDQLEPEFSKGFSTDEKQCFNQMLCQVLSVPQQVQ